MKHFGASSRTTLLCLYCVALMILMAEYWNFMGNSVNSTLTPTSPSILYHDYCVHYDIIAPPVTDFDRIGQILHVSADMLDHRINEQVFASRIRAKDSGTGPARGHKLFILAVQLKRLRRNSHAVARHLRAHVIFARSWSQNCTVPLTSMRSEAAECEKLEVTLEQVALYPANLARNVARMFSATKYIIITDYEHLFNEGFEATVRTVADTRLAEKPQTMLVYRIFEIDEKVTVMPRDKAELEKLYDSGSAVVFHSKYYPGKD
ncbi:hypothetical protein ANCCEY_06469 [Ancylostoma ceylanicum]|uniref:Uncharacterized protein n=1 Tax=Ancylostoma ceylanicum TaxID=53326 RepID=A0A0D6LRG5_9BILA|nr:hypothetical protein ANCCEY_06469 [Ancylostoma ceylanicum]